MPKQRESPWMHFDMLYDARQHCQPLVIIGSFDMVIEEGHSPASFSSGLASSLMGGRGEGL